MQNQKNEGKISTLASLSYLLVNIRQIAHFFDGLLTCRINHLPSLEEIFITFFQRILIRSARIIQRSYLDTYIF